MAAAAQPSCDQALNNQSSSADAGEITDQDQATRVHLQVAGFIICDLMLAPVTMVFRHHARNSYAALIVKTGSGGPGPVARPCMMCTGASQVSHGSVL